MTPETHTLTIHGSQTKYWIYNPHQNRTILAVHGFRGNHLGLQYIVEHLPQYRIIIPDLPGFGQSLPMSERIHNIQGYCDFVVNFMSELNLSPVVLLGHSFGSLIAAQLAADSPNLFTELILINPISASPRAGFQIIPSKLVETYYWLTTNLTEKWSQRLLGSRNFSRLMSLTLSRTHDPKIRRLVYAHHLADANQPYHHRKPIAESFAASLQHTTLDHAHRITLKTLIIAGTQDPLVPMSKQQQLHHTVVDSQLILIPKVGHLIHLETPLEAANSISTFLG